MKLPFLGTKWLTVVDSFIQSNLKLPDGRVQEEGHGWWWFFSCSVVSASS